MLDLERLLRIPFVDVDVVNPDHYNIATSTDLLLLLTNFSFDFPFAVSVSVKCLLHPAVQYLGKRGIMFYQYLIHKATK